MSRIGKKPVQIPGGVSVTINGNDIEVKGPLGTLKRNIHNTMKLTTNDDKTICTVVPVEVNKLNDKFYGLTRSLVYNMVAGVSTGYKKSLKLVGVGYRAAVKGQELNLTLGFSHPVVYDVPKEIKVTVEKQTTVHVEGADKELVGQVAANIRAYRKPEPYHGKGVRYSDEVIVTKVGKAAGKK